MQKSILLGLMMMCMSLLITATTASAISIDVNVVGIFDSTFAPKGTISPDGDFAIAFLDPGDVINIEIIVENAAGAVVTDVSGTIIFQGNELSIFGAGGFGGSSIAEILVDQPPGFPPPAPTSLSRIAQPAIKINSPFQEGQAGDVWLQAGV